MQRRCAFGMLMILSCAAAYGQDRDISVSFQIAPKHLYNKFKKQETEAIVKTVVESAIATLNDAFPLFHFQEAPAAHSLEITLDDDPRAGGVSPGVYLIARLDPGSDPDAGRMMMLYRTPAKRGVVLPSYDVFAKDLGDCLKREIATRREDFVSTILGGITVARTVWPAEKAFVLPLNASLFAEGSRFFIRTKELTKYEGAPLRAASFDPRMPEEWKDPTPRLEAVAEECKDATRLGRAANLTSEGVRLIRYNRQGQAPAVQLPSQFEPRRKKS